MYGREKREIRELMWYSLMIYVQSEKFFTDISLLYWVVCYNKLEQNLMIIWKLMYTMGVYFLPLTEKWDPPFCKREGA